MHYTYPAKNIQGEGCDRAFVSASALDAIGGVIPSIGDDVEFTYNRFGKVVGFVMK